MRRKECGASLFQYVIIICLVGLGIVPCYYLLGNNIKLHFTNFYNSLANNNDIIQENASPLFNLIVNGGLSAGQLGGSPANPVSQCADNNCSIDFGTVVLNNIPKDYSEIIETSGASGGTDVIVSMVQQIAEQLEDSPQVSEEQLAKIKDLISYGNDIKNLEMLFEQKYERMLTYKDELAQYSSSMNTLWNSLNTGVISQAEFDAQRASLTAQYRPYIDKYNEDVHGRSNVVLGGEIKSITLWDNFVLLNPEAIVNDNNGTLSINQPEYYFDLDTYSAYLSKEKLLGQLTTDTQTLTPVGEFMQRMLDLSEDDMNPELLTLTQTLSKEIFDISQAVRTNIDIFGLNLTSYNPEYAYNMNLYDPIYGGDPRYQNSGATVFDVVTNNNMLPSQTTRMDLNIMCNSHSGDYDDNSGSCTKQSYKRGG